MTAGDEDERTRPRPGAEVHVSLEETSAGWVLTLHTDADTAHVLTTAGVDDPARTRMTISIAPNLVPGRPFDVDAIRVAVRPAVD